MMAALGSLFDSFPHRSALTEHRAGLGFSIFGTSKQPCSAADKILIRIVVRHSIES